MNLKWEVANTLKEISPSDWRKSYIEYLMFKRIIGDNLTEEEDERITNINQFFTITNGKPMRKFVANEILKECISKNWILEFF